VTVILEGGYTLPNGDQPLTHARIAHDNNWLNGGTVTASSTATGFFANGPTTGLTYEKWSPSSLTATWEYDHGSSVECDYCVIGAHTMGTNGNTIIVEYEGVSRTNLLSYSEQFDQWTDTGPEITVTPNTTTAPDGNTTADTISKSSGTFEAVRKSGITTLGNTYTASVYLKMGTAAETRLTLRDPGSATNIENLIIDWTNPDLNAVSVGNGWYRASLTCSALGGSTELLIYPSGTTTATGSVYAWGAQLEEGTSATPYIRTTAAAASSTWYDLTGYTTLTTDEPLMAIFEPKTRQSWRLRITAGSAPEIGVIKFGKALQMERPLYGGHTPVPFGRQTTMRSNQSETGEFLGRTRQRLYLTTSYDWQNLTAAWVRTNWPPFQKAIEESPFFIAWRPGDVGDVVLAQTNAQPIPTNMGVRDLMSVGLQLTARGYD